MDRLRNAVASANASASSVFRAPAVIEESSQRSSTAQAWSNARRRLTQGIMERMGKAEASDDYEYEARKGRMLQYDKLLKEARDGAGKWLDSSRLVAAVGGSGLAQALRQVYGARATVTGANASPPPDAGVRDSASAIAQVEVLAAQVNLVLVHIDPGGPRPAVVRASAAGIRPSCPQTEASTQIEALDAEGRAAFDNAFIRDVLLPLDTLLAETKALQGSSHSDAHASLRPSIAIL